ncbi:MAG: hypothetical protein HY551_07115 [Elusimicrobia bacterium]|nr:hypothetical protein [Elusimicrobiota bacterium]
MKYDKTFWLAAWVAAAAHGPAAASFQNMPSSIKAEGMGGAFVGMADDSTALFVNPAGLTNLERPEMSMMYGKPLYGIEGVNLSNGYATLGVPLNRRFALGFGAMMFNAAGIISEYEWSGGASYLITPRVALGATASYLYHKYDVSSDPAYSNSGIFQNGDSAGAMSFGVGLMAFASRNLQFGISGRNLNAPNVSVSGGEDKVARTISVGSMYRTSYANVQAELEQRNNFTTGAQNTWKLGVEIPLKMLALRAGLNTNAVTAGFGVALGNLRLDYAFSMLNQLEASQMGNQMLAVSYGMGGNAKAQKSSLESGTRRSDGYDDVTIPSREGRKVKTRRGEKTRDDGLLWIQ